jgi:hypothetical protein
MSTDPLGEDIQELSQICNVLVGSTAVLEGGVIRHVKLSQFRDKEHPQNCKVTLPFDCCLLKKKNYQ